MDVTAMNKNQPTFAAMRDSTRPAVLECSGSELAGLLADLRARGCIVPGHDFDLCVPLASIVGLAQRRKIAFSINRRSNRLNFRATLTAGEFFRCPLCPDMGTKRPLRFEAALIGAGSVYAVAVANIASASAFFLRRFFAVMLSMISRSNSSRVRPVGFVISVASPLTAGNSAIALCAASMLVCV